MIQKRFSLIGHSSQNSEQYARYYVTFWEESEVNEKETVSFEGMSTK